MSSFEKRVQINKIIESQLPEFLVSEFPKATEFFKQYYVSEEFQGGNIDLIDNLDQYLKLDNLVPEVITGSTTLSNNITASDTVIQVSSTKGFPSEYGLLKVDDEIITYTGLTENSFTGCIRGFSGIAGYNYTSNFELERGSQVQTLQFSETSAKSHNSGSTVKNLSVLFLQEFYKKLKYTFTPGLENIDFVSDLDVGNFIKNARSFYQSKGVEESVKILFKVLYGQNAEVLDLESRLIKPSYANYVRREVVTAKNISGDPLNLEGQTIYKSNDLGTNAAVSNVEIFTRDAETFYKIELFIGYDERDLIEGTFTVPGKTKVTENINVGSSVISVDSTIGFLESGTLNLVSNGNSISYTSKSINQFFGCSGINQFIPVGSDIRSDETIFGYENGVLSKRVDLRITGVISEFEKIDNDSLIEEGEEISIRNLGEIIENPQDNEKNYKQTFANSWIYNTSTRHQIKSISGSTFTLYSEIDKSSLKIGDRVDILSGFSDNVVFSNATITSINRDFRQIILSGTTGFTPSPTLTYDIRRKLKKSTSSSVSISGGNNIYLSDVLNVYTSDDNEGYVASNSLPSYQIDETVIEASIPNGSSTYLGNYNSTLQAYSSIKFRSNLRFIDGDLLVYTSNQPLKGLTSGLTYYVRLIASNEIRLYESKSLLNSSEYVLLGENTNPATHTFTLKRHEGRILSPNKLLRKFPLEYVKTNVKKKDRRSADVISDSIGILVDGVEITNPESSDKVYYGPIKEFEVLNPGNDYDVINPPKISISSSGAGTTALVEPIIRGSVKKVFVDAQDFDVENIISISLVGGNGSGCILEPVIGVRYREVEFDSRSINIGGGVDLNDETITFLTEHNFVDGERVVYNQNGNNPILTGPYQEGTNTPTGALVSGDQYIAKFVNTRTIKLFNTESDYNTGINTVGLSTTTTFGGIHKFLTLPKNTLRSVKVLESGSNYEYRKLRVNNTGISTHYDCIFYENHGFKSGDVVTYSTTGTEIVGLSTLNQYSVDVLDDRSFKLINVGAGATFRDDITKNKHVVINSTGSGDHIFQYPPIEVNVNVSYGSSVTGSIVFTPVVTGEIVGAYLYEKGSGYGSDILNLQKKPLITIKNGKNAQLSPLISNGRILEVQVLSGGSEYFSIPEVIAQGTGSGAILKPVINGSGVITRVDVLNGGIGYDSKSTTIKVTPRGFGAKFDVRIRDLTVNDAERQAPYSRLKTKKIFSCLNKNRSDNLLSYGIYGYSEDLAEVYSDIGSSHSPIIGWAYDGNPIYGPYGYSSEDNVQSGVKILESSYSLDTSSVFDRPSKFQPGFFIEDYQYNNTGDLDEHNGRFCKTPEFPDGIYAYFATVTESSLSNTLEPKYPYFIGNTFRSSFIRENTVLNQSFDFNNSNLIRNTYPYKINDLYADYDFLLEPYERFPQICIVESIEKGSVDRIDIVDGGSGYRIGERINFDEDGSGGFGLRAEVSELIGKEVTKIETSLESYSPCTLVWETDGVVAAYYNSGFDLLNDDTVLVGSISTSINNIFGSKKVGFSTQYVGLAQTMASYSSSGGISEDIVVSPRPRVSIGNSITITSSLGEETVKVLNDYGNGVLKVKRFGNTGVAHRFGSNLKVLTDKVTIPVKTEKFVSERDKLVYFNAKNSVGVGTTAGGATSKTFAINGVSQSVSIPFRSIYIPDHPFKTGQRLDFRKSDVAGVDSLIVGDNDANLNTFQIPDTFSLESTVYVINKGKNYIGLVTNVGLTTNSDGLYFYSDGSDNSEYLLETNLDKITAQIDRVVTTVSVGQSHGLRDLDTIKLTVIPNTVVGLGTTSPLSLSFNEDHKKLLVNQIGISSSQISTVNNNITITNHGYSTGDKLFYYSDEVASGLTTGSYYVIKESSDTFRLAESLYDTNPATENSVNIVGTGSSVHKFGLINPQINVVKNSTLQFNLSDPSLIGYNFKLFVDKEFKNQFISAQDSGDFNVIGIGTVGFGTASLSIKYSNAVPTKLFYALEKSGYISTADKYFENYSEINYTNSEYDGSYQVFGISTSSFKISPRKVPSVLSYSKDQTEKLEYSTSSSTAINGSVGKVKIISEGFKFKKLPKFSDITTVDGSDANLVAVSTSIGRIKNIRFKTLAYEYPSDTTLNPEASTSPIAYLDNMDTIGELQIIYGGSRYLNAPDLLLWNETTKTIVDDSSLVPLTPSGAISEIKEVAPLFGLKSDPHRIIAINNSNGVGISSIVTDNSGIATCTIATPPILGFSSPLFNAGDEIFVEGIELINGSSGTGYNSENYDFRFFRVESFTNSNPAVLKFSVVDEFGVGLSTNPGIAKTFQSGYATIINKKYYPVINVVKERAKFNLNEQIYVDRGNGFSKEDVYVKSIRDEYIKVSGRFRLKSGDKIKGESSGVIADVLSVSENRSRFKIGYSTRQNIGWSDDIGKISEDYQVTPDNDYYQNLSYSIKSPVTWNEFSGPVNSIIHPAGLKNFADVGIVSSTRFSPLSGTTNSLAILDIYEEKRVDVINNFDNVVDYDTRTNPDRSKYLKIQNRKLTDYTECRTNRVIIHDDISNRFLSRGFEDPFIEIEEISTADTHVRYLIQIVDPDTLYSQITELVVQTTNIDSVIFEKYSVYSDELLGNFSADVDSSGRKTLIFTPTNRFTRDHDIKILKKSFEFGPIGVGTETFGSINLIGKSLIGISSVGTASSIGTIAEFSDSDFNGLFANIEIVNTLTREVNYIDAALDFDGTNTYLSEYYFDTTTQGYSSSNIGIVTAIYDSTSGIVSFRVKNDEDYIIDVRTNIISFAATSAGIGTYRFLVPGQPNGSERSVKLESTVGLGTTSIRVATFDYNLISSSSSIVRVSCGNSSAIHQVATVRGSEDIVVVPGSFSATDNVTGLGTFGSESNGNEFYLNFYPDIADSNTTVQAFNEVMYTFSDFENVPRTLTYGNSTQTVFLSAYDSINGTRANKVNFNLTHEGRPIYKKVFNPSDDAVVDFESGIITIVDHMFNTGEELIYTPKSSFIGVGQSAIGIGSTANYLGVVTDRLPEIVYPIAITPDTFKLATQRSYANLGIAVTFTDSGLGNSHELEMTKKLTKSVVSLDGIVQQPITFTPVSHTLQYNSGSINSGISTFNLSGISSIQPRDLVKIDDEYMKVIEVGFSTNVGGTILGPINGIIQAGAAATIPTISVVRASVGSTATSHTDGSNVQIYRGSFNIVGSEIWFVDPPKGNTRARRDESNLPYVRAQYAGRTFLRANYDTNILFDDISDQFTGIGKTYTMTVEGINTTGVTIGNGILFINGVFQTPSTLNNSGNNYEFENDNVAGISSVVFTGITSTDGSYIKSDFDINQNQLPRGGLIVSLGSTPGLGYAPLLGAKVKAELDGSGSIVSITGISHTGPGQSISTASYNNETGIIEITTTSDHNFVGGDRIKLVGLGFTCPSGAGIVSYFPSRGLDYSYDISGIISARSFLANVGTSTLPHSYIGFGTIFPWYDLNDGSGYRGNVSIGVTDPNHTGTEASITAVVGAGGTLGFVINDGGSGYVDPYIDIPEPIYENLEIVGVSRAGVGETTETGFNLLLNLNIGPSKSNVGIGSTLFLVDSFQISRSGYGFRVGDVFKPVGLVTAKDFSEPISEFQLEVVETFQDYFSSWSFGEMNYIDSISTLQNGNRTRFPLIYNGQLLSFEIDSNNPLSSAIDLDAVLIIFVNGVIQQPSYAYRFSGGTSFEFTEPPKPSDKVDIFFYLGQNGVDVTLIDINETIKIGDEVFVLDHPLYQSVPDQERERTILDISGSDTIETDNYVGVGIDETIYRPIEWIKQKRDQYIKGDIVYKSRDSIEPFIYPTARIIGDFDSGSTQIFVDNALFFNFEEDNYGITINSFGGLVVDVNDPVSAAFTATVSIAGTVSDITIINPGFGYSSSTIPVKISAPSSIGIGIGTTATAVANVSGGIIQSVSITNPGLGYTSDNPPQLIVEIPKAKTELIQGIANVQGFSGIITGISTTTGTGGHPLALKINFRSDVSDANDLQPGYPILVYNTTVGSGLTSVNSEDSSVVGIGTSFLDNIYIVNSKVNFGPDAEIVCNIHSNSDYVGIETYGSLTLPLGNISWGRIYNFDNRTNPISIGVTGLVVDSGLTTFPTIQRRIFGLRNSGGIRISNLP